jgi:nucleoside-diphosphate-sugar epimerase
VKVGITGAAGFIGTWLCRELEEAGHSVHGTDLVYGLDLLEPGTVAAWLRVARPDVVVHLAAQVGRIFSEDDIRRTVRLNAEMTAVVAQACGAAGVRLVYASTSEIYGDQGDQLCYEDGPVVVPQGAYGLTKRWGEEACRLYAPDGLVIVRPSMPYGPGAPPGRGRRAMDTMLWQAHHRMPITVHRGAERSWCWIGDTVRGIRLAIEATVAPSMPLTPAAITDNELAALKQRIQAPDHRRTLVLDAGATVTTTAWDVYNIGRDDDPRPMLEVARLACKLAGAPEDLIVEVEPPPGQTAVKRLSTDRLRALGWAPTVDLEDGMRRVYDWVSRYDADGVHLGGVAVVPR